MNIFKAPPKFTKEETDELLGKIGPWIMLAAIVLLLSPFLLMLATDVVAFLFPLAK